MNKLNYCKLDTPLVLTKSIYPFNILYVNKSWEKLCGYSKNEVLGKSILILVHKFISNNILINKKKNEKLFLHIIEIYKLKDNISLGITKFYKDL